MSFLFKRIRNGNNKRDTDKANTIKCKECGMTFQGKDRLDIHRKKAHSGKGERKKDKGGMHQSELTIHTYPSKIKRNFVANIAGPQQ